MAHECPACGLTCYCNGDIGDMCLNRSENQDSCIHCDYDYDVEDDPEGAWPPDVETKDNLIGMQVELVEIEGKLVCQLRKRTQEETDPEGAPPDDNKAGREYKQK